MKYPIIKNKQNYYPKKPLCPVCKKRKIFETHTFVGISGGACLMDRKRKNGGPDPKMDGFWDVYYHDHKKTSDKGFLKIADDIQGGQFDFYFCSPKCLRAWLNKIVDDLEARIQ